MLRKLTLIFLFNTFLISGITTFVYSSPKLSQDNQNVLYESGSLFFNGVTGNGIIEVYSIIGNKIITERVLELSQFEYSVSLELGNMYIIRVIVNGEVKTFKIVAS